MSDTLPVSVIVPCHDAAQTLVRAVESVAAQSLPPRQVILVDDASSDRTETVISDLLLRGWPFHLETTRLPENRGPAAARNEGIAHIDPASRYVAFLDADDWWLSAKLATQVAWMEGRPDVAWTAHRCGIGGEVDASPSSATIAARPITKPSLLFRNTVATPTVVVRSPVPERFRDAWRSCEDLMLWLDLLDRGRVGFMLDAKLTVLGRRPTTPGGSTGNLESMHAGEQRVLDTLTAEGRLSPPLAAAWRCYVRMRYMRRRLRA